MLWFFLTIFRAINSNEKFVVLLCAKFDFKVLKIAKKVCVGIDHIIDKSAWRLNYVRGGHHGDPFGLFLRLSSRGKSHVPPLYRTDQPLSARNFAGRESLFRGFWRKSPHEEPVGILQGQLRQCFQGNGGCFQVGSLIHLYCDQFQKRGAQSLDEGTGENHVLPLWHPSGQ